MQTLFLFLLMFSTGGLIFHLSSPRRAQSSNGSMISFALSFLAIICFTILAGSCKQALRTASGVVNNPKPDSLKGSPCIGGLIQVVQVTDPGNTDLNKGDNVAFANDANAIFCDGDTIAVTVKKGKRISFEGTSMQAVEFLSRRAGPHSPRPDSMTIDRPVETKK